MMGINLSVEAIKRGQLERYAKEKGLDLSGLSEAQLEDLHELMLREWRANDEERQLQEQKNEQERIEAERMERFNNWVRDYVPRRFMKASREDFGDAVKDLFSLKQSALILGGNGIGKSHLAWAIAKTARWEKQSVVVVNMYRLLSEIKDSTEGWYRQVEIYAKPDILIVDEYDKCNGSAADFVLFSELVDERYDQMRTTIVIGNGDVASAQSRLGQSVYSRLTSDGGKLYCLDGSNKRKS